MLTAIGTLSMAQTATNFTCNDCKGFSHDLFTELDAGKVIVLCWVMPCGSCVGPSLTTYNVVQSYQTSNPNTVYMYLCDDYANTNCTSLTSWANSHGITDATLFSSSDIKMEDYGSPGMPKVVVVGDVNHAVFYNANNSVNATALQDAINTAIASIATGIKEEQSTFSAVQLFPNPSNTFSTIFFTLKKSSDVKIEVYSQLGNKVSEKLYSQLSQGKNNIDISTAGLSNGVYFVKLNEGTQSKMIKLTVSH